MEHWSVRQLGDRIDSMLYERTAISKKPDETIAHDIELLRSEKRLTTDMALRDPLILGFLGLKDTLEHKLHKTICVLHVPATMQAFVFFE